MDPLPRLERYVFERFELQPSERRLLVDGVAKPLTPRAFDILAALVERPGDLWSKDDLLARVWPRVVVEENNLQVHISTLRKLVGAGAIETVPGHGYRFTLGVVAEAGQPSAPSKRPNNLPRELTSFIGRERELDEGARLLKATRLLTVTGMGGIGKTRLVVQLAQRRLDGYPDGAWLVELASLADPTLVAQGIASILGVHEQPPLPILESVAGFVRDRQMLLILDNCEHVAAECARVGKLLLQAASGLTLLTSSREPLHLPGETTYSLPPLSMPTLQDDVSIAAAMKSDAVRLLVDRATAVQRNFQITPGNARAVREICVRLDGIPLALELAAARLRALSAKDIAERLDDRFRLLKLGDSTAPARQQTLQATIDWSYQLLNKEEKTLLARLSVFAGGFDLESAEAVGAGPGLDAGDILDVLAHLVDKSLVAGDNEGRYRLLETVRIYAQARLAACREDAATRTRHLAYFVALVDPIEAAPRTDEETWVARLDRERENLRAAYQWAVRSEGDPARALRMVSGLAFWLCMNYFDLGTPILGDVLARPEVQERNLVRFHGLAAAGFLSYHKGRYSDAKRYAEAALSIARATGPAINVTNMLIQLGEACHGLGGRADARAHLTEGLALAREAGPGVPLWAALNALAEILSSEGETPAAGELYEETLAVARTIASRHLLTCSLLNLARVSLASGSDARASALLREALGAIDATGTSRNLHALLSSSAGLAALRGEWERTARFFGASERDLERMGLRREPADEAALAPLLERAREGYGPDRFRASLQAGRSIEREAIAKELRAWLAAVA